MTILIVAGCVVVCYFFFPVSTCSWLGEKAKSRAAQWASLLPKKKEEKKKD
jgi:hypothetical protein